MDFRTLLIEETTALGGVLRDADPARWEQIPVPTCPGWDLLKLLKHVGRGNRWCAQIIAQRLQHPLDPREVHDGKPPADPDEALAWLDAGAQLIIDSVERVGGDAKVWTFIGPKPAGWWVRRRVHETIVHRADAQLALGLDVAVDAELAADGVSEWLTLNVASANRQAPPLERGLTLHLHANDEGLGPTGEWTVVHDEDGINWSHDHTKGEVALRGRAVDLLLAITRRKTTDEAALEVYGDPAIWDGWLARTPF